MYAKLFFCAQGSALDSRLGTISAFHILEEMHAPAYPVVIPAMSVIALLGLEDGEVTNPEVELRVFLGDQQLFAGPVQANFQTRRKARALLDFNGLVVPAPGDLRIVLHSTGRDIATWQVTCYQTAPAQMQLRLEPEAQPTAPQGQ